MGEIQACRSRFLKVIKKRRAQILHQASELAKLFLPACDVGCPRWSPLLAADGVEALEFEFLATSNDNAPLFDIDTMAVKAFMTWVLLVPYKKLTNHTLMMSCEMLSMTLLRILLSQCGKEYLHDFAELEDMTRQFVSKHIPLSGDDDE